MAKGSQGSSGSWFVSPLSRRVSPPVPVPLRLLAQLSALILVFFNSAITSAVIKLWRIGNYLSFETFSPLGSVCLIYVPGTSFNSCHPGMYLFITKEGRKWTKFKAFKQSEHFLLEEPYTAIKCGNVARQAWESEKCRSPYFSARKSNVPVTRPNFKIGR